MPEAATASDLMLAILGSSVGLGGLLLVFCGYVFSQANTFTPEHTDDTVIARYKKAGSFGLWPFLGSILDALLALAWFFCQTQQLFWLTLALFVLLLLATATYGGVVILKYL